MDLTDLAFQNLHNSVYKAIEFTDDHRAVVIFDDEAPLTRILTDGYRRVFPDGTFLNFNEVTEGSIRTLLDELSPRDLVILVQSANFRLNEFRFRIELFKMNLATIEHMHLNRMREEEFETYIQSLDYNPDYFRKIGPYLKSVIDQAQNAVVRCGDSVLYWDSPFEDAKLNIGDYRSMDNVGGTFPIGEVFSELQQLEALHGEAKIFAFAGKDHMVRVVEPFRVKIEQGILSETEDTPSEFIEILDMIRADEPVYVREFGLGLNPAMDRHTSVRDITGYERMAGLHLSLGAKHGIYAKPGFVRKKTRYHVDVLLDTTEILMGDTVIFKDGKYVW